MSNAAAHICIACREVIDTESVGIMTLSTAGWEGFAVSWECCATPTCIERAAGKIGRWGKLNGWGGVVKVVKHRKET